MPPSNEIVNMGGSEDFSRFLRQPPDGELLGVTVVPMRSLRCVECSRQALAIKEGE